MNMFWILLFGFILGTLVSVNSIYVLIKFYAYVRFRHKKKQEEYKTRARKENFRDNYIIELDDDNK